MSSNRGMDKEDVVYLYNGLLLSHKKEQNYAICRDVNGPRVYHTEWGKSEREKQLSDIKAYIWSIQKLCRWTYLKSRNRYADVEIKSINSKQGGGSRMNWEIETDIFTCLCIK